MIKKKRRAPRPALPVPPARLDVAPNVLLWEAGRPLHRVYPEKFSAMEFNPGRGRTSRFAPIHTAKGAVIPTCYAGSTRECAFHERIFHDVPIDAQFRSIAIDEIGGLACAQLKCSRPLRLAQFFEPDLRRWGLTRRQLIDTSTRQYGRTALWAQAVHRDFSDIDGLVWTSRVCDPELSALLFGDRVDGKMLEVMEQPRLIELDAQLLGELDRCAQRAGIYIVR